MAKVMINLAFDTPAPTVETIRQRLGLRPGQIDEEFGVIEVDPEKHVYTILVDDASAQYVLGDTKLRAEGPFSNPTIAPFGPPQTD